jgi:hypothetical protein
MRLKRSDERRAVILMVVLALLTLFAILGITFVLYADSEATAARIFREAESQQRADIDPEQALAFILGQLIYDVPDTQAGAGSGLRGYSLARSMYGFNYTMTVPPLVVPGSNAVPFNGVGRLHYANTLGVWTPQPGAAAPPDDYTLVNYTWFQTLDMVGRNGFFNGGANLVSVRDPERFGIRQTPAAVQGNPYVGGNVPYTYPDLNNLFLAAVQANGTLISPSFHRAWSPFGTLAPTNPNWYIPSAINPALKYMVLRPRPVDHNGFPAPEDAGGDVKNLAWAPGGNDSIWIDIGAPVMTAPDGTKYKMLVAPLILDLDGRINLNTAGNILASGISSAPPITSASLPHVSNQGWGPWEVSLAKVLYGNNVIGVATPGTNTITNIGTTINLNVNDTVTVYSPTNPANNINTTITAIPNLNTIMLGIPWPNTFTGGQVTVIDQEWSHLFSGKVLNTTNQNIPGRYLTVPAVTPTRANIYTNAPGSNVSLVYPPASTAPGIAPGGTNPHFYAPVDANALNENAAGTPAARLALPPPLPFNFPTYQTGAYLNGGTSGIYTENLNHPLLFNPFRLPSFGGYATMGNPIITMGNTTGFTIGDTIVATQTNLPNPPNIFTNTITAVTTTSITVSSPWIYGTGPVSIIDLNFLPTRAFRASDMEPLLRPNTLGLAIDSGSPSLLSDLIRLCPKNFGPQATSQRYGNLVTTLSMDLGVPGVIPYWYSAGNVYPVNPPYPPANNPLLPPFAAAPFGNAVPFPNPITAGNPLPTIINTSAATSPINSEFGIDWRWTNTAYNGQVLGRLKLNRPLPPYPHMGSGLVPPYGTALSPFGIAYDLTNAAVSAQLQAAVTARQTLANDIYRRLLSLTGTQPPAPPANLPPPAAFTQALAPCRWLAQLAANIVDYIDDDDINTPFNFYNATDGLPANQIGTTTPPAGTVNGDDNVVTSPNPQQVATGMNPVYWVFGTELPKVVINEVLAETQDTNTADPSNGNSQMKVWVELYNTMQQNSGATAYPQNAQQQDGFRVPFYMNPPAGSAVLPYSPYRVSICQNLMSPQSIPLAVPDASANVLGKPNVVASVGATTTAFPANTSDADFAPTNSFNAGTGVGLQTIGGTAPIGGVVQPPPPAGTYTGAGIDPQGYLLIGPPTSKVAEFQDPFLQVAAGANPGIPANTPSLRTTNMVITPTWIAQTPTTTPDERTTGLTVTLRRLANPYLQPTVNPPAAGSVFYNPYVTVDYLQSVPLQQSFNYTKPFPSRGKRQPYAAFTQTSQTTVNKINYPVATPVPPTVPPPTSAGASPVVDQGANITPTPAGVLTYNNAVQHTFGLQNAPLPQSGKYDWLVHLDRQVISPMELLHVSGYQPYQLTQQFIVPQTGSTGDDNAPGNMFKHYVPWLDRNVSATATAGSPTITMSTTAAWWNDSGTTGFNANDTVLVTQYNTLPNPPTVLTTTIKTVTNSAVTGTVITLAQPWTGATGPVMILDQTNSQATPQSHRLYRLFEFLECGDRAYGVDGWGRIPGRVNINTIWDPEPLQAILDANQSIGIPSLPAQGLSNVTDPIVNIFSNMLSSRTPNLTSLSAADRPFLPLSIGLNAIGTPQYPNGTSVAQDTVLRLAPPSTAANIQTLLFQNPSDTGNTHPYLQTQLLTKLYNNVTTRSNVFAVWLTVGFFQVTDPTTTPPTLGAEIGRSEGRHVRHRMFAIVDRTNLNVFSTNFVSTVSAATGWAPSVPPGSILIPSPPTASPQTMTVQFTSATGTNPSTGVLWSLTAGMSVVFEPGTDNEETVVLQAVAGAPPGVFSATFYKSHLAGVPVIQRGNPGPWATRYDPRLDPLVVPHYSIID